MTRTLRLLAFIVLAACGSDATRARYIEPCHREATAAGMGEGPAIARTVERVQSSDVVLLGEHHGDVAEIDFLVSILDALDSPTILAMELVPASAPATPSPDDWTGIVGDRYWPAPLYFREYARVIDALHAARQRGVDLRLAGLAPDCRLPNASTDAQRKAAIACFRTRDAFMADRLKQLRADHPEHRILVSAGWRHVSKVRLPGADKPMGAMLPAHWTVWRMLLAGTEARETGPRATCMGGPLFFADLLDKPALFAATGYKLTLAECVDTPSDRPLADAFDQVVGLPTAPAPTPWTTADFEAVDPADRAAWARTHRELMGKAGPPLGVPELARLAEQDAAEQATLLQTRVTGCPEAPPTP